MQYRAITMLVVLIRDPRRREKMRWFDVSLIKRGVCGNRGLSCETILLLLFVRIPHECAVTSRAFTQLAWSRRIRDVAEHLASTAQITRSLRFGPITSYARNLTRIMMCLNSWIVLLLKMIHFGADKYEALPWNWDCTVSCTVSGG
jgi:hypothetical protein